MTALTVSSWASGAVRSAFEITECCQNTGKLQRGHGGKRATTVSLRRVCEWMCGDAEIFRREVTQFLLKTKPQREMGRVDVLLCDLEIPFKCKQWLNHMVVNYVET